jgi:CHAT domain-containing protein
MIGRQSPFLVVDASRVPGSGHLPGLADQRKTIAELFPQATIVDSTARSWNQINQIVSNSAVFHYMGHGRADGTGTTLAYGPNHPLSAKDFSAKLFRNSQLVVLAACSTAKQKENGSWDSNSLIYVLLQAGVPQIVATRWNVDSAITSQFMIDFYQHIQQHNTVEQAVFEARKQTMASTPHPYYWAGFSIAGRIN